MKTESNLERVFEEGHFAVTAELAPPQNADTEMTRRKASIIKGYIDAFNVPDGPSAVPTMASWAVCFIGKQEGLDPIVEINSRDRNRIALQMNMLGLPVIGVSNILCLSGDPISSGNNPQAKPVMDVNPIELIKIAKNLRDEKIFQNGEPVQGKEPRLYIGATANPFADPDHQLICLAHKVEAGADFIQTQAVFDIEKFEGWMQKVRQKELQNKVRIIAGITPLKSVAIARYMKTYIPGMDVPDEVIERLRKPPTREQTQREGVKIATETINRLKGIEGVAGIHIIASGWEEVIPDICKAAGLYPRPSQNESDQSHR
jgi:5,10-methylenetetrahydrofolate reductase